MGMGTSARMSLVIAMLLTGCVGRTMIISTPSWHTLSSGLYDLGGDRVIYGIGQADGIHNPALLRASADNQARRQMALVLEKYVDSLTKSDVLETDAHWATLSDDERRQVAGMLVRNCMRRAVVSDHWNDAQQARLLSLCRLDLATVKQVLSDSLALDEKTRPVLWAEADRLYARLARKY